MSAFTSDQQAEIAALVRRDTERLETLIRQLQGPVATAFLQLATAGDIKVAFGTGTWTWPGGAQPSNTATITHNLGRIPTRVFLAPNQDQGGTVAPPSFEIFAKTSTTFNTRGGFATYTPGAGATSTFDFLVVG